MPHRIFHNMVIALAGPQSDPDEKLRHWIGLRKGVLAAEFGNDVTHLVATREQLFDRRNARVLAARKRGPRDIKLVLSAWLDKCLVTDKKGNVKEYCGFGLLKARDKAERLERQRAKMAAQAETYVDPAKFRAMQDADGFKYQVDLTRPDGEQVEIYTLTLFQSISSQPHMYVAGVRYCRKKPYRSGIMGPAGAPRFLVLTDNKIGTSYNRARYRFCAFFRTKTGVEWEDRDKVVEKDTAVTDTEAEDAVAVGQVQEKDDGGDKKDEKEEKAEGEDKEAKKEEDENAEKTPEETRAKFRYQPPVKV